MSRDSRNADGVPVLDCGTLPQAVQCWQQFSQVVSNYQLATQNVGGVEFSHVPILIAIYVCVCGVCGVCPHLMMHIEEYVILLAHHKM